MVIIPHNAGQKKGNFHGTILCLRAYVCKWVSKLVEAIQPFKKEDNLIFQTKPRAPANPRVDQISKNVFTIGMVSEEFVLHWAALPGLLTAAGLLALTYFLWQGKPVLNPFHKKGPNPELFSSGILRIQLDIQAWFLQKSAAELHENIGHILSVARINLDILVEINDLPEPIQASISQTSSMIGRSIEDVRLLTQQMESDFIRNFACAENIRYELRRIRRTAGIHTELVVFGTRRYLGYQTGLVLF